MREDKPKKPKAKKGFYIVAVLAAPEGYENRGRESSSLHVSVVMLKGGTGWKESAANTITRALPSATGTGEHVRASVAGHVKVVGKGRRSWAYSLLEEINISMPEEDPLHPFRYRASKAEVKATVGEAVRRLRNRLKRKQKHEIVRIGQYTQNILKANW